VAFAGQFAQAPLACFGAFVADAAESPPSALPALHGGASLYPWAYHPPPEKLIKGADTWRLIPAGFPQIGQSISIGAEKLESFSSLAPQATQQYSYNGIFPSGFHWPCQAKAQLRLPW